MSDEALEQEVHEERQEHQPVEGRQSDSADTRQPSEVEDRARRMGWVPEDEFRGDKSRWRDAESFLKRGEEEIPILRERLRSMDKRLAERDQRERQTAETIKKFAEYARGSEERAYQKAKRELSEQQRQAFKDGDEEKFEAVTKKMEALESEKPKVDIPDIVIPEPQPETKADPVLESWVTENKWYNEDPEMAAYAFSMGEFLARTKPHLRDRAQLDEVTKLVKKAFPDKFTNPNREKPSAVHGGENYASTKGGGSKKSYNNLPSDAKRACDDFVKAGLCTEEEYLRNYDW